MSLLRQRHVPGRILARWQNKKNSETGSRYLKKITNYKEHGFFFSVYLALTSSSSCLYSEKVPDTINVKQIICYFWTCFSDF